MDHTRAISTSNARRKSFIIAFLLSYLSVRSFVRSFFGRLQAVSQSDRPRGQFKLFAAQTTPTTKTRLLNETTQKRLRETNERHKRNERTKCAPEATDKRFISNCNLVRSASSDKRARNIDQSIASEWLCLCHYCYLFAANGYTLAAVFVARSQRQRRRTVEA